MLRNEVLLTESSLLDWNLLAVEAHALKQDKCYLHLKGLLALASVASY